MKEDFSTKRIKQPQLLWQKHGNPANLSNNEMKEMFPLTNKGNNIETIDLDPNSGNNVPKEDSDNEKTIVIAKDIEDEVDSSTDVHKMVVAGTSEVGILSEGILSDLDDFLQIEKVEENEENVFEKWRNIQIFSPTCSCDFHDYEYEYIDREDSDQYNQIIEITNLNSHLVVNSKMQEGRNTGDGDALPSKNPIEEKDPLIIKDVMQKLVSEYSKYADDAGTGREKDSSLVPLPSQENDHVADFHEGEDQSKKDIEMSTHVHISRDFHDLHPIVQEVIPVHPQLNTGTEKASKKDGETDFTKYLSKPHKINKRKIQQATSIGKGYDTRSKVASKFHSATRIGSGYDTRSKGVSKFHSL